MQAAVQLIAIRGLGYVELEGLESQDQGWLAKGRKDGGQGT